MKCPICGDIFDHPGVNNTCPTCKAALEMPEHAAPAHSDKQAGQPPSLVSSSSYKPAYPSYRKPDLSRPVQTPKQFMSPRPAASSQPAPRAAQPPGGPVQGIRAVGVAPAVQGHAAGGLVGTVVAVTKLDNEPPDRMWGQILFSILLTIDLVIILGWIALVILAVVVGLWLIAAIFRAFWLTTLLGVLVQLFFSFLTPLLNLFRAGRDNQRLVPVTNYTVRAENGRSYTARIKGQPLGATIETSNRVQLWGRPRHDALRVEGGLKIDTGEHIRLPFNWDPVWWVIFFILVIANVVGYFYLNGQGNFI